MKRRHLRLALPRLAELSDDTPCAFALVDRHGQLLRAGALPLDRIASALPSEPLCVVLAPDDAVATRVAMPPVSARQLSAAVAAAIEPLVLSDIADVCIAHSPRDAHGMVTVAWAQRRAIVALWARLAALGLTVNGIFAHTLAVPVAPPAPSAQNQAWPVDAGQQQAAPLPDVAWWQAPLPAWSLAAPALRPASQSHPWRAARRWAVASAVLWLAGLMLYAHQQMREVRALQDAMQRLVQTAFPQIPVVIAPLKQAGDARDALRRTHGMQGGDDFLPIAVGAARVLDFAAGHVHALHYDEGRLRLTLTEGYTLPANEAALMQAAAAQSLRLEKDAQTAHVWHVWAGGDANRPDNRPNSRPVSRAAHAKQSPR